MNRLVIFHDVKIEGFGSIIEPLTYDLKRNGLNIISGKNGSGKTSIFSALCWAIFGKTLKKNNNPEPWDSIKPDKFKGTLVTVNFFTDGRMYAVFACNNYKGELFGAKGGNRVILVENGKVRNDLRDKGDIRKEIVKLVGGSFNLFKASVIFGQKLKRIIQEDGPKKKEVFEEAFEVEYINIAKKFAEKKREELRSERAKLLHPAVELESTLKALKSELNTAREFNKDRAERIKKFEKSYTDGLTKLEYLSETVKPKIKKLKGYLEEISVDLKTITAKLEELEPFADKHFRVDFKLSQTRPELKELKEKRKEAKLATFRIETKCSRCGARLDKKQVEEEKGKLFAEYESLSKRLLKITKECEADEELLKKLTKKIASKSELKEREKILQRKSNLLAHDLDKAEREYLQIKHIEGNLKIVKQNIKDAEKQVGRRALDVKREKEEVVQKLLPIREDIRRHDTEISDYDWVIKDPLSNSGIKAYVFNQMLAKVNNRLKFYASYLGYAIRFGIDMESARKDFYAQVIKGEQAIDYEELSGGQQQLVDICIAFAIHDVRSNDIDCNMLVMDEIFESLDEENIEIVADLIRGMAKSKALHLITHLKDFTVANARIFKVRLDKAKRTVPAN